MSGVCPRVAIMEVKHKKEACVLNALAELLDILQILHHTLVRIVRGIDEESHAHRVPSLLFQEVEHICDGSAVLVEIGGVLLFKLRQHGDVSADVALCVDFEECGMRKEE